VKVNELLDKPDQLLNKSQSAATDTALDRLSPVYISSVHDFNCNLAQLFSLPKIL